MSVESHEAYLAALDDEPRRRLLAVRDEVESRIPDATRCVSYQMPALRLDRVFFFFASFRHHVGVYPPLPADHPLATETARWRGPKGNLAFPHEEPLPVSLIGRVAEALAEAVGRRPARRPTDRTAR